MTSALKSNRFARPRCRQPRPATLARVGVRLGQELFSRLPHEKLQGEIEARLGADPQMSATETDVLFSSNPHFATVMRASIGEDWLAAWSYAMGRFGAQARQTEGDERRVLERLGEFVKQALRNSNDPVHARVRREITDLIDEWKED